MPTRRHAKGQEGTWIPLRGFLTHIPLPSQSKAQAQYLLTPSEADRLPSVTCPDGVTLMLRGMVQGFKSEQYEDGYDGLLAAKAERVLQGGWANTFVFICLYERRDENVEEMG